MDLSKKLAFPSQYNRIGGHMKKIITETNDIIKKLMLGQTITIKFHCLAESKEVTGMIIKIDKVEKNLYLPNCCIPFANIIMIST